MFCRYRDVVSLEGVDPASIYHDLGGKLRTTGEATFSSLEEWMTYPHKESILQQLEQLRAFMASKSSGRWKGVRTMIGMAPGFAITPIFSYNDLCMESFVDNICRFIHEDKESNPLHPAFINTELGYELEKELLSIREYSRLVFRHTFLRYDSLIVEGDKLVGVINWKYAGFYPAEFDNVLRKYITYI